MRRFFIISLVLLFSISAFSQRPRFYYKSPTPPPEHFTRDRTYDVIHIKLELNLDEKTKNG
jgi:hypothetical protein